jgi:hypothetical protein
MNSAAATDDEIDSAILSAASPCPMRITADTPRP